MNLTIWNDIACVGRLRCSCHLENFQTFQNTAGSRIAKLSTCSPHFLSFSVRKVNYVKISLTEINSFSVFVEFYDCVVLIKQSAIFYEIENMAD